jgi:hypothetical protein
MNLSQQLPDTNRPAISITEYDIFTQHAHAPKVFLVPIKEALVSYKVKQTMALASHYHGLNGFNDGRKAGEPKQTMS